MAEHLVVAATVRENPEVREEGQPSNTDESITGKRAHAQNDLDDETYPGENVESYGKKEKETRWPSELVPVQRFQPEIRIPFVPTRDDLDRAIPRQ